MQPLEVHQPMSTKRSAAYKWLSSWRRKWAMPSGRFGHRDTPSVEVMRAKVNIGFGHDLGVKKFPDVGTVFRPSDQARKSNEGETLMKNEGRKNGPIFWTASIDPLTGVDHFRPPFFRDRGPLDPKKS